MKIGSSIVAVEDTTEIQAYIDSGKATPQTPVRQIGGQEWAKLEKVKGLRFPAPKVVPKEVVQPIPEPKAVVPQPVPKLPIETITRNKFNRVYIPLGIAAVLLVAVSAVLLLKSDPKTSFERRIVAAMKSRMEEACSQPSSNGQVTLDAISYDITRTNSEVTPFTGMLEVRVTATDGKKSTTATRSYDLAYRDGVWKLVKGSFGKSDGMEIYRGEFDLQSLCIDKLIKGDDVFR